MTAHELTAAPVRVAVTVNGDERSVLVDPRWSLADLLRIELGLTGTHVGCEVGACGACTVLANGASIRACLTLAVQADGLQLETIEGVASGSGPHPLQEAFRDSHSFQCGFCTPGMLMCALELLRENTAPTEADVRAAIAGNLCRCTGYESIVDGILLAAERLR